MVTYPINPYDIEELHEIFSVTINGKRIWNERLQDQSALLAILARRFNSQGDMFRNAFSFSPGVVYFGTPLTNKPAYTESMKKTWHEIKRGIEQKGWKQVYAPFDVSDPHSKTPDNLDSYQLSELDYVKVLNAEVGLFDLNVGSNGVGRECELALTACMPTIGFSKERVSRMDTGSPGILALRYNHEDELKDLLLEIFGRDGFQTEPFYVDKRHEHKMQTVIKGDICLNCKYKDNLHPVKFQ